jgi:hypothetical protein
MSANRCLGRDRQSASGREYLKALADWVQPAKCRARRNAMTRWAWLREPFQTNYSILARVHGEEVVFAGDARSGDGQ